MQTKIYRPLHTVNFKLIVLDSYKQFLTFNISGTERRVIMLSACFFED